MSVDPQARVGFQRGAARYERGRPEAPAAAVSALVDALKISDRSTVVELGAGTGKLARLLAPRAGRYLAVEPVPGMRRQFRQRLPEVPLVGGLAEHLPVPSRRVDAVVAAQAFHWFDVPRAMGEIRRVLALTGHVGLLWNVRDESVDWVRQATAILDRYDPGGPRFRHRAWQEAWERTPGFEPLRRQSFPFVQPLDRASALDRFTSVSFIASLEPERYAEAEADLRALFDRHPQTAGRTVIELPHECEIYTARPTWGPE
ncbi:MAG TPA: class I SAM-dependent methyltransferase [Thermoplasmata archaeon]|nr:class I SAM-dependent methyltransferase [Thermoplasmata archaeon]